MARYMILSRFRDLTLIPGPDIDLIESQESGWIQRQIDLFGSWLDARLVKRYAVPFGADPNPPNLAPLRSDVPGILEWWITAVVTLRCYGKRGFNPSSTDQWFVEAVLKPHDQALADIQEAANTETSLFDLPLRASATPGGEATRSGPLGYTEASPFVNIDVQAERGREEDSQGSGSS